MIKKLNGFQKYLIECLEFIDDFNELEVEYGHTDPEDLTDIERIDWFFKKFNSEFNDSATKRTYPNFTERVAKYLQSLPSGVNIAYIIFDIKIILTEYDIIKDSQSDYQKAKEIENWFKRVSSNLIQIHRNLTGENPKAMGL